MFYSEKYVTWVIYDDPEKKNGKWTTVTFKISKLTAGF